jgi:peroxiredoxin
MFAMVLSLALYAPAAEGSAKVEEGKPAPNVELEATQIEKVLPDKKDAKTLRLSDLNGKNVVLYFFPKALTGG